MIVERKYFFYISKHERKYFFYISKHSGDLVTVTVDNVVPCALAYKTYIPTIFSRIDIVSRNILRMVFISSFSSVPSFVSQTSPTQTL